MTKLFSRKVALCSIFYYKYVVFYTLLLMKNKRKRQFCQKLPLSLKY